MHLQLDYPLGPTDYIAQHAVMHPVALRQFKSRSIGEATASAIVCAAGLYAALRANLDALAFGFVCVIVYLASRVVWHRRHYRQRVEGLFAGAAAKQVRLVIDDQGLRETVEGIESFAPWSAVKWFTVTEQATVLKLGAELWSFIPHSAFAVAASREEFHRELSNKAIPQRAG